MKWDQPIQIQKQMSLEVKRKKKKEWGCGFVSDHENEKLKEKSERKFSK